MKEWSDEELDKLFRKSAEEFEPQYEPNDWKELRHRLDDTDQVLGGGWFEQARPWTIALLLLMILGGVSVYYRSSKVGEKRDTILPASSDKRSSRPSVLSKIVESPMSENASDPTENEQTSSQTKKEPIASLNKINTAAARQNTPIIKGRPEEIKELPRNLANVSGVRKQTDLVKQERGDGAILLPKPTLIQASKAEKKGISIQSQEFSVDKVANKQKDSGIAGNKDRENGATEDVFAKQNAALRDIWPAIDMLAHRAAYPMNNGPELPKIASFATEDVTFTPERSGVGIPKWAIRIGVSPDLSVVNMHMRQFTRPGPAGSLLVERSIGSRWIVQAGVIRSLKTYNAQAGDYEWPSNWYQKQRPVSIKGTCQVFELPLNVRYDISQQEKGRWFAGAGVSSYKMQKEKYIYHYETYDPNIRWWKWEGKTGWYFLSHANASAGYERLLTRRLSIMAEPYVRIPLRKVGFGKVNLFSTGIWFSVRYTPAFR